MCDAFLPYFSAFLTLLIGSAAAYLGYRQQQTNTLRLKHELFERRYKVYDSLMVFLSTALREGKTSTAACLSFLRETNQAHFLFGAEIREYLELAYKKGIDLMSSDRRLSSEGQLGGEERARVIKENTALMKWFGDQFDVARERFGKYLNLTRLE